MTESGSCTDAPYGRPGGPAALLSGLDDDGAQRGLSAKVADMYVELVRTTMFNSR